MKYLMALVFMAFGMNVVADDHLRDVKTANPFVALHPSANQEVTAAYYDAVEKNVFNGAIPLKYAQLAALSASVAMRCEYCCLLYTSPSPRDS